MAISEGLKKYALNKILSLGVVGVVILGSYLYYGFAVPQWQFILVALITFGYGHFLVGFFYQLKSFLRKPNPWQQYLVFALLTFFSITLVQVLFQYVGYAVTLFIGFMYFLLHGLFNEQTLIKRQVHIHIPLPYILALAFFVMALLTYTIPDPTFFFSRSLEFASVDTFILVQLFQLMGISVSYFSYIFWFGVALSFLVLLFAWFRTRLHTLTIFFGTLFATVTLTTFIFGALPYIYMYLLVVGYHFMTWFLFYISEMKARTRNALSHFMLLHILVLFPFCVAGYQVLTDASSAPLAFLLDYKYFVIATYVHISTSFMNDAWFISAQTKLFTWFEKIF